MVQLKGLTRAELNGLMGIVIGCEDSGRWRVNVPGNMQELAVKAHNLCVVTKTANVSGGLRRSNLKGQTGHVSHTAQEGDTTEGNIEFGSKGIHVPIQEVLEMIPWCELHCEPSFLPDEVLGIRAVRDLPGGSGFPSGSTLLDINMIANPSRLGYIEEVQIYDEIFTKKVIATSRVHIESVLWLCGEESVNRLHHTRRMNVISWVTTGGDPIVAKKYGICGFLHKLSPLPEATSLPAKGENENYFIRLLTKEGPVWSVKK
jgi:hypothetical protein